MHIGKSMVRSESSREACSRRWRGCGRSRHGIAWGYRGAAGAGSLDHPERLGGVCGKLSSPRGSAMAEATTARPPPQPLWRDPRCIEGRAW